MKTDVTREQFDALGFDKWTLCDGNGPNGEWALDDFGDLVEPQHLSAHIILRGFESSADITFAMLQAISQLFETTNIDIESSYDGPLSDVTPGQGFDCEIWVRP